MSAVVARHLTAARLFSLRERLLPGGEGQVLQRRVHRSAPAALSDGALAAGRSGEWDLLTAVWRSRNNRSTGLISSERDRHTMVQHGTLRRFHGNPLNVGSRGSA